MASRSLAAKKTKKSVPKKPKANRPARLGFREKHLLENLPDEIATLEREIADIEEQLATPNLFQNNRDKFNDLVNLLTARRNNKDRKELEWLEIAEKAEALTQAPSKP